MEYTKYLNLEGDKPGKSFASLSTKYLDEVAGKVNLRMGIDTCKAKNNIEHLKENELEHRLVFKTRNPDLNLPANLDVASREDPPFHPMLLL